jgi:hypothetical protein
MATLAGIMSVFGMTANELPVSLNALMTQVFPRKSKRPGSARPF